MDIRPQNMDGTEATRLLKADERMAHLAVVALTPFAMKGDRDWFLVAGFDGYFEKPITVREFPGQLRSLLRAEA